MLHAGDDVTPSVTPAPRPSHHSGPGYVANAKARDFEIHEPLKEAAARWLDLVPAEHRHEGRESAKDALETLQEHTRSCPDHPLGALWVAHRHLKDPGARGPDRGARARLGGAVVARSFRGCPERRAGSASRSASARRKDGASIEGIRLTGPH